ncbi:MAG: hypothetical protein JXB88_07950 [Spirochaetales bacterium]|nr:hypothetical protein [Spirochaetales bacterium]
MVIILIIAYECFTTRNDDVEKIKVKIEYIWIIYPGEKRYQIHENITVLPFIYIKEELKELF